jgi:hypothetical protein
LIHLPLLLIRHVHQAHVKKRQSQSKQLYPIMLWCEISTAMKQINKKIIILFQAARCRRRRCKKAHSLKNHNNYFERRECGGNE